MSDRQRSFVNLNGVLVPAEEARISLFDHGLLYGDGLFETVAVCSGRLFRAEAHLRRLKESALRIGLEAPWSTQELLGALQGAVEANGIQEGAARLTMTRGEGPPVPDPSRCARPQLFVTVRSVPAITDEDWERGVSVCAAGRHPLLTVPGVKSLSYLTVPGVKSLSYLPFQRARQEARRRGCDDGLLLDGGCVVEASMSNVFAVRGGELFTPDLSSGCLPGIARGTVLELAASLGIAVHEISLSLDRLCSSEEAFLTNSLVWVLPVVRIEEQPVGNGSPGPITRRLRAAYRDLVLQHASVE